MLFEHWISASLERSQFARNVFYEGQSKAMRSIIYSHTIAAGCGLTDVRKSAFNFAMKNPHKRVWAGCLCVSLSSQTDLDHLQSTVCPSPSLGWMDPMRAVCPFDKLCLQPSLTLFFPCPHWVRTPLKSPLFRSYVSISMCPETVLKLIASLLSCW